MLKNGRIIQYNHLSAHGSYGVTPNNTKVEKTVGFLTTYVITDLTPPLKAPDEHARLITLKLLFAGAQVNQQHAFRVLQLSKDGSKRYELYNVHYKKDKHKKIYAPRVWVKRILERIARYLSLHVSFPAHVFGVRGRGVAKALRFLCEPDYPREVDIQSAYPSTPRAHVESVLARFFQKPDDPSIKQLAIMLSPNFNLPIGYPTSPIIFNMVMEPVDALMAALMDQHAGLRMVRYVDNIYANSHSKELSEDCIGKVQEAVKALGYLTHKPKAPESILSVSCGTRRVKSELFNKMITGLDEGKVELVTGMRSYLRQFHRGMDLIDFGSEKEKIVEQIRQIRDGGTVDMWGIENMLPGSTA